MTFKVNKRWSKFSHSIFHHHSVIHTKWYP